LGRFQAGGVIGGATPAEGFSFVRAGAFLDWITEPTVETVDDYLPPRAGDMGVMTKLAGIVVSMGWPSQKPGKFDFVSRKNSGTHWRFNVQRRERALRDGCGHLHTTAD
jgi:hypothetical protein